MLEFNKIYDMEGTEGLYALEPHSVDLIVADLPYGVTKNKYDIPIPFHKMWEAIDYARKSNTAILLFGQGKFYINLCASNIDMFRHDYCWNKILTSGFLNASSMPLRQHENIAVFYEQKPTYNPQFTIGQPLHSRGNYTQDKVNSNYSDFKLNDNRKGCMEKYPTDILSFPIADEDVEFYVDGLDYENQIFYINDFIEFQKVHPSKAIHQTEKPAGLMDFLIRTYSNPGDLVVDFTCGSASTNLAAIRNKRKTIGFDFGKCLNPKSKYYLKKWADIGNQRIKELMDMPEQITFV